MKQNYKMIDVGEKVETRRVARARGSIVLSEKTMDSIRQGVSPKGDILKIAEVAGIMATKNTSNILPLCHPLLLNASRVWFKINEGSVDVFCEVSCGAKTGVEMEALVGVNVALLTIYDLAKAIDPVIEIKDVYLESKIGGKSGEWYHPRFNKKEDVDKKTPLFQDFRFSVATLSDRASRGEYEDLSGPYLKEQILENSGTLVRYDLIRDSEDELKNIISINLESKTEVLLLTGGTGISKKDITPEVLKSISTKELVGFGELQRQHGATKTPLSWLSRSSAFVVEEMLVVLFPGSRNAVRDGFECLGPLISHAVKMIRGEGH